jgi:hypothetical protein
MWIPAFAGMTPHGVSSFAAKVRRNRQRFVSSQPTYKPIADVRRSAQTAPMTVYADVDPVIDAWANATVKKLFTEWGGQPARFAYLPGLRQFESFQISIEPPLSGRVAVFARSIDTDDGSEFEQQWEDATEALSTMLETATNTIREWVCRPRTNVR